MKAIACFLAVCVSSSFAMNFTDLKCQGYAPPKNGVLRCQKDVTSSALCHVRCNDGYDVQYLQAALYKCTPEGKWEVEPPIMTMPWPDCIIYGPGMPIP